MSLGLHIYTSFLYSLWGTILGAQRLKTSFSLSICPKTVIFNNQNTDFWVIMVHKFA